MPTVQEGRHAGEFIVAEGNGTISRETVTVLSGEVLEAGAVLGKVTASGEVKALDPAAVDGSEAAAAILHDPLGHAARPVQSAADLHPPARAAQGQAELMGAFGGAVDATFAAFGRDAIYTPTDGEPITVRVIAIRPDVVTGFGETRIHAETATLELRASEVAAPRPGDALTVDGECSDSVTTRYHYPADAIGCSSRVSVRRRPRVSAQPVQVPHRSANGPSP
jgi:hypothetical protein